MTFRKIQTNDKEEVISLMEQFYSTDAVSTNGSREIFEADFENCVNESPFLEGYIIEIDARIAGYAMIAKSFSTEFGKNCIWFEDLYLKKEHRGLGIIPQFIKYVEQMYPDCIFKLEVEKENTHATHVYCKQKFKALPYLNMIKI